MNLSALEALESCIAFGFGLEFQVSFVSMIHDWLC